MNADAFIAHDDVAQAEDQGFVLLCFDLQIEDSLRG
jgi:hypothetical protein